LFAVISCGAAPQGTAGTAPVAKKSIVLENERKIWDAFKARNANAVSALLADDLQVVTVNGRFDKASS